MVFFTDLHEEYPAPEVVYHPLKAMNVQPFNRIIQLSAGNNDPERDIVLRNFLHLGNPLLFRGRYVDVSSKVGRFDGNLKALPQKLMESVKKMPGTRVAPVDQWVFAVDLLHAVILFV